MPFVFFDDITDGGKIVVPAALQKRSLERLSTLLKVHFRQNLVIKFEILLSFVDHVHEGLLIHEVGRGEIFGVGIKS